MFPHFKCRKASLLSALLMLAPLEATHAAPLLPAIQPGNIALHLATVASGLGAPSYAISPPGETNRLFVVEQNGLLRVIENNVLKASPALDLRSRVSPPLLLNNGLDERGFIGLAFHPDFNTPGSVGFKTLYTYTSEPVSAGAPPTFIAPNGALQNYRNVITEWKMSDTDAAAVDVTSRREILSIGKNAGNNNGGNIAFGPDRMLYVGVGDGGNTYDIGPSHLEPGGNAQNLSTPLGKVLRIDPLAPSVTASSENAVSDNGQYRILGTNPFAGAGQVRETYALGFRNPYRFSFDTVTGDLILADVGQNNIEEIDRVVLGGNYGWAVKEGDFLVDRGVFSSLGERSPGSPDGLIDPISGTLGTLEYDHGDGSSITGGFVYRGTAISELAGKYVFGDLSSRRAAPRADGRLFYADLGTGIINEFLLPQFANGKLPDGLMVRGFGQDGAGELYALLTNTTADGSGGIVYRLAPVPLPASWIGLACGALGLLARRRRVLSRR